MLAWGRAHRLLGALCTQPLRPLSASAASASASAPNEVAPNVVDEMVVFARANFKDKREQALDVLASGLALKGTGVDAGRLHLVRAEVEADRSAWAAVCLAARSAATAASEAAPADAAAALLRGEVELLATVVGARASLAQHKDAEAYTLARAAMDVARKSFAGAAEARWAGLATASALAGLVQHAAGELDAARDSFATVARMAGGAGEGAAAAAAAAGGDDAAGAGPQQDHLIGDALTHAAAFALAEDDLEAAAALAARAVEGTHQATVLLEAAAGTPGAAAPGASPLLRWEAAAGALLVQAQVAAAQREWPAAEDALERAVRAAEAAGGGTPAHPRVALPLAALAGVYARTARATLAEGLYREAAKLAGADPGRPAAAAGGALHPSVVAVVAWRYAQLLAALPRREAEAAAWQALARDAFDDAPGGRAPSLEVELGGAALLKGEGEAGRGVVLDMASRRALPRLPGLRAV